MVQNKTNLTTYVRLSLFTLIYFVASVLLGKNSGSLIGALLPYGAPMATGWWLWGASALVVAFFLATILLNKDMFSREIFWLGSIVFFVDAWVNFSFYHSNTYKILVLYGLVVVLFIREEFINFNVNQNKATTNNNKIIVWLIVFVSVLAALPGAVLKGFVVNYNFTYELSALIPLSILTVYVYSICHSPERTLSFLKWFGFVAVMVSFWSFYEYYTHGKFFRVKGTFGNATYFASYLAIIIPVFLSQIIDKKDPKIELGRSIRKEIKIDFNNWVLIVGALGAIVALYLTVTRISQAGLLVGLFLALTLFTHAFYQGKIVKYLTIFFLLIGGVVASVFVVHFYFTDLLIVSRIFELFSVEGFYPRFIGWTPALRAFLDSIWFGHGLGSSYSLFFNYMWENTALYHYEASYNHVHNEYLQIAEEGGILGLLGQFVPIFVTIFFLLRLVYKKDSIFKDRLLAIMLLASFVGCAIDSMFSISQRHIAGRLPFYVVWGLSLAVIDRNYNLFSKLNFLPKWIYSKKTLVAIFAGLILWNGYYFGKWAFVQYQYVKAYRLPAASFIRRVQDVLSEHHADVYASEDVANRLLRLGRFEEASEYYAKTHEVIPYYRVIFFRKCLAEMRLGNYQKAFDSCRQQQVKNPYLSANNLALVYLGLRLNEKSVFLEALKNGLAFFVITNHTKFYLSQIPLVKSKARLLTPDEVRDIQIKEVSEAPDYFKLSYDNQILSFHVSDKLFAEMRREFLDVYSENVNNPAKLKLSIAFAQSVNKDAVIHELVNGEYYGKGKRVQKFIVLQNILSWVSFLGKS